MKKVGIIILNYLNYEDTIKCVESSKKLKYENTIRVIVDNGSTNQSKKILKNKYKNDKSIKLIFCDENLGYASGNDIGIIYCRHERCDYILIVNNDTIFIQEDFIERLLDFNEELPIGAIGPKILDERKSSSNPIFIRMGWRRIIKDFVINITIIFRVYDMIKRHIKNYNGIIKKDITNMLISDKNNPFILHGSAIMLTPQFFKKFKGLYSGTFLYYEENILSIIFQKDGLKFLYQPNGCILHKEDGSSKISNENDRIINAKTHIISIIHAAYLSLMPSSWIKERINNGLLKIEREKFKLFENDN